MYSPPCRMYRVKRSNEYVSWINTLLQSNDTRTLDDLKSGVALLQVIHSMNPDAFDLSRVDFCASNEYYYHRNLKLLQQVCATNKIDINFNIAQVAEGEKRNDLFGLVSYLRLHYETLKAQVGSSASVGYSPDLERKRARERRNAKFLIKPFRVATLSHANGRAAPDSEFNDTDTVMSDTSQALSAYSTLSTKHRRSKMKIRDAELQRWARGIPILPGASQVEVSVADRTTTPMSTTVPRFALSDAVDFEPLDLGKGSLFHPATWPKEVATEDESSALSPRGSRSPTKGPSMRPGWFEFDKLTHCFDQLRL